FQCEPANTTMIALPRMIRCASLEQFTTFTASAANQSADMQAFEAGLLGAETFTLAGCCAVCARETAFLVDHISCYTLADGSRLPNWRERLVCPYCQLNNRMRAAVGFLLAVSEPGTAIYLTECVTPLFHSVVTKRTRT